MAVLGNYPAEAAPGGRGQSHSHSGGHGFRHGGGARIVFFAGPVFPFGYYYPPPYYYYPPLYYSPAPPPVYIEQPQPSSQAYWYFCQSSGAYYPYVQSCATGWQRMLPQSTPD